MAPQDSGIGFEYLTRPSALIALRTEHVFKLQTLFPSRMETLYEVAVCQAVNFWEWMFDLSDPIGDIDQSPNWPAPGSDVRFRVKSNVPFVRSEEGTITMQDCEAPKHALMKEVRYLPVFGATSMIEWSFEMVENGGTLVSFQYSTTAHGRLANFLMRRGGGDQVREVLVKQIRDLGKVCDSIEGR